MLSHVISHCGDKVESIAETLDGSVFFEGNTFWAPQKAFRVLYIRNFAELKPYEWNSVKADYDT